MLDARRSIVVDKVKGELQARNINDAVRYFEAKFGLNVGLDRGQLSTLARLSAERNLWVHNRGIVNEVFLGILRRQTVEVPYQVGDRLKVDHVDLADARALYKKIAFKTAEAISADVTRISRHYEVKFGTYP